MLKFLWLSFLSFFMYRRAVSFFLVSKVEEEDVGVDYSGPLLLESRRLDKLMQSYGSSELPVSMKCMIINSLETAIGNLILISRLKTRGSCSTETDGDAHMPWSTHARLRVECSFFSLDSCGNWTVCCGTPTFRTKWLPCIQAYVYQDCTELHITRTHAL